ncbi:MAG: Vitamin B12-dependent ribonucleoside-diphosphate reductase [Chloroflexi bacterium]|nr:Vitamin B12-dependent ribonucleoside-diphosphate reductase [Chloroflexota bacterium]
MVDNNEKYTTPPLPEGVKKVKLSDNAYQVFKRRYLRRNDDGEPIEEVEDTFWRVAYHIAKEEEKWGENVHEKAAHFYDLLASKRFLPNSPTFTGAGTPLGQLAACFVLPLTDDMGRREDGIFQTLRNAALIQQTGGGNGFSFSQLRPRGDLIKTSAGHATGPVGFLHVYDQAFGEIAQGGCLVPETLVFTGSGLLYLDEIVDPKIPGWQEHNLSVPTDEGARFSPRGYNNGVDAVLQVSTRQGITLSGTPDHKVKVMSKEGPAWRPLSELRPGDSILTILGQHKGKLQALRKPTRQHGNQVMPAFPSVLDETLAFLLGYLAGDGFVASSDDDHRIGFSISHDSYLMEELPKILEELFPGVRFHHQQKDNDDSITLVIDNRAIKDFLLINGLEKPSSTNVFVPRLIRQSPPNIVGAYLRGLFEADGALSHNYPQLNTTSYRLAEEVAMLLIGLGAPVSIRQHAESERLGEHPQWLVRLRSHMALDVWQQHIGCDEGSRFMVCYTHQPDFSREKSYILPQPKWWIQPVLDAITLPQIDSKGRGTGKNFRSTEPTLRKRLLRYLRGNRHLTLSAYRQLENQYRDFADNALPVESQWFLEVNTVEEVEPALTLDLEVDDNHTYLANGIVTHNTRRGANMAVLRVDHPDIEDFIACKTSENAITNFNISIGITDAFMEAVENDDVWELRFPDVKDPTYRGFHGTLEEAEEAGIPIVVYKTLPARELFQKIVEQAHHNGEPGVLFLDTANRDNPVPHLYRLKATNPCVTGETLIYTENGLQRAVDLAKKGVPLRVATDGRFGKDTLLPSTAVVETGIKDVYRLTLREGYELRLTADHQVMTEHGWIEAQHLKPNDKVHIFNRRGGFGDEGTLEEGRVLGWLVGDGTINIVRAVLSFFGDEKSELAPAFSEIVTDLVDRPEQQSRHYPVGIVNIVERNEARVSSARLRTWAESYGLTEDKLIVPEAVFSGSEEIQRGFLQALFTADGQVNDGGNKGCSVRLSSSHLPLLKNVQKLLLNFGIASKIYEERRSAGFRMLPDGKGGVKEYYCLAQHDLAISKTNLISFTNEIGFLTQTKQDQVVDYLNRMVRGPYQETFTATVLEVEPDGKEMVYDLQQPDTHSFVANGLVVHNCGEQFLGPYENCCLGSVNLAQHATEDGNVDWEKLQKSVELATYFLDDVVDANAYVPAVPKLEESAHQARRIGLGIMGLGDLMFRVGVGYGSEAGQEFASQVMEFVRYHTMLTSVKLAGDRGAFPAIRGSVYDPQTVTWPAPVPLLPHRSDWGRPHLDWDTITRGIAEHGIRNAAQTTIAPTGTTGTVSGCEGYGCEPVFALAYTRHVEDNGQDLQLTYTSPLFEAALVESGLEEETRQTIVEQVVERGTCQGIEDLPAEMRETFVVAQDITAEEHVRTQAALQAFVDNSISKTINFPAGAQPEDVAEAYQKAWELGCKGLTVYVTGSREKVVLETNADAPTKDEEEVRIWNESKKPRPQRLMGSTYNIETPLGKTFVTINENGNRQPFEVFVNTAKAGSDTAAVSEAIGRSLSYILRLSSPISPRERMGEIVRQLLGIGGRRPMGFGSNRVHSLPDGVAQVLREYLNNTADRPAFADFSTPDHSSETLEKPRGADIKIGDLCPDCGQATLVNEEGCRKCYSCGYSEC